MMVMSRVTAPLVSFLDISGRAVLRLLGLGGAREDSVTEDEIRTLVAEANTAGVIEHGEVEMISRVMGLGDRPVRSMMTPRIDVDVIDLTDSPDAIRAAILASPHSRLPARESPDGDIIGVVQAKTLLDAFLKGETPDPRTFVTPTPVVPETADALDVINALKSSPLNMALVYDEYGHFEGVVTTSDILEAITGAFSWTEDAQEPDVVHREDGSALVSGSMAVDLFAESFGLPLSENDDFTTAAGWVLAELKRLPSLGEAFERHGYRIEVIDLDGRRIDKLLVSRLPDREAEGGGT
jgi:putative hemolysin